MQHKIDGNTYIITDENGKELFKIELTSLPNYQIVISTPKERYAGPIEFITFGNIDDCDEDYK